MIVNPHGNVYSRTASLNIQNKRACRQRILAAMKSVLEKLEMIDFQQDHEII